MPLTEFEIRVNLYKSKRKKYIFLRLFKLVCSSTSSYLTNWINLAKEPKQMLTKHLTKEPNNMQSKAEVQEK